MISTPWFSIVVPVFNRPKEISRCIDSCLAQTFKSFELIIVDDGSTDETPLVVNSYSDGRIHFIRRLENQGMSYARALGHQQAAGQWIVRIDSDHALYPDALRRLYDLSLQVPKDVGVIGAKYRWDNGLVTPPFLPRTMPFDYIERVQWSGRNGDRDYVHCVRKAVFANMNWPARKGSTNALMELDIAFHWKTHIMDICLAEQYTDAENSYHRSSRGKKFSTRLRNAADQALTFDEILEKHGDILNAQAPQKNSYYHLNAAFNYFLSGNRQKGLSFILKYIGLRPFSLYGWVILIAGLLGVGALRVFYLAKPEGLPVF